MVIADTTAGVDRYRALVVRQGLKACKLGMRLNTAYTPKRLMRVVQEITGRTFKLRDYDGAIAALNAKLGDDQ